MGWRPVGFAGVSFDACISGKTSPSEGMASSCEEEVRILVYGFKLVHPVV